MRRLIPLVAVALTACSGAQPLGTAVEAPLGESFPLGLGQTARVSESDLRIRFERVAEDSRCPTDVQCVWAGNARVVLFVALGVERQEVEVNTGVEPRAAEASGFTVSLEELQPLPSSRRKIPTEDYTAILVVTEAVPGAAG